MFPRKAIAAGVGLLAVALTAATIAPSAGGISSGGTTEIVSTGLEATGPVEYLVLLDGGSDVGLASLASLGATVIRVNDDGGYALVSSDDPNFIVTVEGAAGLAGAARNQPIGHAPVSGARRLDIERLEDEVLAASAPVDVDALIAAEGAEPLASLQWDMAAMHVPEAHAITRGNRQVLVGVIDTGIDATHPDIAPNFNAELSRNFTTDIPLIDGPCEEEDDASCEDAADVDEDGHGTHVAGTIGAAINGRGIAGVAPDVQLVNLRAGQDSGYFFLEPVLEAILYAGENGIDVVNMSFFVDPWLFNCKFNAEDTKAERLEQRTIWKATQRAIDKSWNKGTTFVAALGNEHLDMDNPRFDMTSPDFPPGSERTRPVDDATCRNVPAELRHVVSVVATGPTGKKADYSSYGLAEADLAAPGGFFRDGVGTDSHRTFENLILSAMPASVARASGAVDLETGESLTPLVISDCGEDGCAYYQYLQGTSMASPHVAGVAALIVSQWAKYETEGPTIRASKVEKVLFESAVDTPCPAAVITYAAEGRDGSYDAACIGDAAHNSIYGHGMADALAALQAPRP